MKETVRATLERIETRLMRIMVVTVTFMVVALFLYIRQGWLHLLGEAIILSCGCVFLVCAFLYAHLMEELRR